MKTSKFTIIDADARSGTDLVCVATNGSENRVHRFNGDAWPMVASWTGAEAASCCLIGSFLICASFYGPIMAVDLAAGRVATLREQCDDIGHAMAAAAWRDEIGLIGGERGRFALVGPESGEVSVRRLSAYGLPRPGRRIYEFAATHQGVYFLGSRMLLFRYGPEADEFDDLLGNALGRREIFFQAIAEDDGDLWLSCGEGPKQLLMHVSGSSVSVMDGPLQGTQTPELCSFNGQLYIGSHEILRGEGRTWESQWRVPVNTDDGVIRLMPTREYGLCAVTWHGTSVFLNGDVATEIAIL